MMRYICSYTPTSNSVVMINNKFVRQPLLLLLVVVVVLVVTAI
jgi:hypothetical protein